MSKLHRGADTAVRSEAKRARSELTRCGLRLDLDRRKTHSNLQFVPLTPDRRHSDEPQLWNNSQEEVKHFFLRSVPLESFGTCVKAAAPQRPSESIQPVCEREKRGQSE